MIYLLNIDVMQHRAEVGLNVYNFYVLYKNQSVGFHISRKLGQFGVIYYIVRTDLSCLMHRVCTIAIRYRGKRAVINNGWCKLDIAQKSFTCVFSQNAHCTCTLKKRKRNEKTAIIPVVIAREISLSCV